MGNDEKRLAKTSSLESGTLVLEHLSSMVQPSTETQTEKTILKIKLQETEAGGSL